MNSTLNFFFHTVRAPSEDIPYHAHQSYELVYYIRGTGSTRIGGKEFSFKDGQYAVIGPNTIHDEKHFTDTEVMFVAFDCHSGSLPLIEGVFSDSLGQPFLSVMRKMALEMHRQKQFYPNMLNVLVSELLISILRIQSPSDPSKQSDIMQYAKAFIDEHFNQYIDFIALSKQSGYSYDRFRHLFKEKIGDSPQKYILKKRIEHAQSLLRHTQLKGSVIAMECGFFSDAQFCSLFKREIGVTPGQYRRENLQ